MWKILPCKVAKICILLYYARKFLPDSNKPLKCLRHASVEQCIAMQSGKIVGQN